MKKKAFATSPVPPSPLPFPRRAALLFLGASLLLASPHAASAQALLYTFNDTGTSSANSGSKGTSGPYILALDDRTGAAADLHTASGTGVSGLAGDRALDLTSATGMGNATGVVGPVAIDSGGGVFNSAVSLTITGWFKAATGTAGTGSGGRLLAAGGLSASYSSTNGATGTVGLALPSATGSATSSVTYTAGAWQFFAITWVASTGAVSFYVGDANSADALAAAGTGTLTGQNMASMSTLDIGGDGVGAANNRPFDGMLDDMAVYTSTTDASGALDAATLNSIRLANLSSVPEPDTWGSVLGGFLALLAWGRMKRARTKMGACPV